MPTTIDTPPRIDTKRCGKDTEHGDAVWVAVVGPSRESVEDAAARNLVLQYVLDRYRVSGAIDNQTAAELDLGGAAAPGAPAVPNPAGTGVTSADEYRYQAAVMTMAQSAGNPAQYLKRYRVRRV